jgi:hypothetical protein
MFCFKSNLKLLKYLFLMVKFEIFLNFIQNFKKTKNAQYECNDFLINF